MTVALHFKLIRPARQCRKQHKTYNFVLWNSHLLPKNIYHLHEYDDLLMVFDIYQERTQTKKPFWKEKLQDNTLNYPCCSKTVGGRPKILSVIFLQA